MHVNLAIVEFQVPLNPRPWTRRWERANLKGVKDVDDLITEKMKKQKENPEITKPWEEHDLMLHYRKTINPYESAQIMTEYLQWQKAKEQPKQETQS